jgi:CBS domain-containing protein
MRVADLMQTPVLTARIHHTLAEAVQVMADAHISGMPVVDRSGRVIGVVTSTDILEAEADAGVGRRDELLEETAVADIMTPRPLLIPADADVHEAAQQMLYSEVHRLFVEADGKLAGVISQTDIVGAVATGRFRPAAETPASGSEAKPSPVSRASGPRKQSESPARSR